MSLGDSFLFAKRIGREKNRVRSSETRCLTFGRGIFLFRRLIPNSRLAKYKQYVSDRLCSYYRSQRRQWNNYKTKIARRKYEAKLPSELRNCGIRCLILREEKREEEKTAHVWFHFKTHRNCFMVLFWFFDFHGFVCGWLRLV